MIKNANKSVAFVFTQAPHGSAAGREGLDALLATLAFTKNENIGVFFVADGVLQLLPQQQPEKILARNYIATFNLLTLYEVKKCYLCERSLQQRGLSKTNNWPLTVEILPLADVRDNLKQYDTVLTF